MCISMYYVVPKVKGPKLSALSISTLQPERTVVPSATVLHIGSLTVGISGQLIILAPAFPLSPPA